MRVFRHETYQCDEGHGSRILVEHPKRHKNQKCRKCRKVARLASDERSRESIKPFVYYESALGEIFCPADDKTPPPKHKSHYVRREATTAGDRKSIISRLDSADHKKFLEREGSRQERTRNLRDKTLRRIEDAVGQGRISEGTARILEERANRTDYGRNYDAGNHFQVWE